MTEHEIVEQLKKHGVHDINSLAKFIVKESQGGHDTAAATKSVIIYPHGFVSS